MALPTSSKNNVTVGKLAATLKGIYDNVDAKKADKVAQATNGNFAGLDGNGNLTDSLSKPGDFATSAQGAKADTAVQSVSINGGSNLKSGTSVDIPLAVATGESGAKSGAMSSDDKKKLNDIATGAEVNQNAFSNVVVGQTTVAASAKTDTLTIAAGTHISVVGNSADKSVTINSTLSNKTASQGGTDVSLVTTGEKYAWGAKQDALVFDGTPSSSNKVATQSTITTAIGNLDVSNITSNLGVGKTITALSETDGKIAATASDIQITESQVTDLTAHLAAKAPLASPALTGTPTAPTAAQGTNTTQIATTEFVVKEIDAKIEELGDAMVYKGTLAGGSTGAYGALTPAANKGWTYKVTTAGKIDGVAVEIGDMLICNTDNTAAATSSNYTTIVSNWDFIQSNIDGAVIGPSSTVTDASVAGFDGTAGHKIKQLSATEIKAAAGLSLVKNQAITVTSTSVSDGTNTFNKYTHPTTTAVTAGAYKVGKDSLGHVDLGSALTKSDVGLGNVVNTGDTDTPAANSDLKLTAGGAYTALAGKVDVEAGKGLSTNDYTTTEKNKLAGIAAGAEVNQNAFSNVKVGSTTVAADTKTDTLELVGSQHITITPDATNDKITIATDIQDQTAYTAVGSATKVPKITTNSLGQVTGITEVTISGVTPASHAHGNITNDGKITATGVALANGDSLVFVDSSDNSIVKKTSITFDGSTATKALTQKGTWETFNNYTHPTYDTASAAAVKVGRDSTGHVVIGDALTKSDVGLGNVANTQITVSATDGVKDVTNNVTYKYTHPTSAGNKHIPSGGSDGQVLVYGGSSGTASWTTLTDASMGQGYSATTSWSSAACTVTMANYELKAGGIVAIKFAAAVPANATLNINGKGAKSVYYRGAAITAGIIQNGDIAYFMYDGTNYVLLGTDRSVGEMTDQEVADIIDALS